MKVKDVMTEHATCISPNDSIQVAAQKMKSLNVGSLPVCENDRLAGIITDRDIIVRSVCEACDGGPVKPDRGGAHATTGQAGAP